MRWPVKQKPKNYEERFRKEFAIYPTMLDNKQEWIWFEFYIRHEIYHGKRWWLIKNLDLDEKQTGKQDDNQ